jgi:hypothetical protein
MRLKGFTKNLQILMHFTAQVFLYNQKLISRNFSLLPVRKSHSLCLISLLKV